MKKIYFGTRSITVADTSIAEDLNSDIVYYKVKPGDDLAALPFWFETAGDITDLVVEAEAPDAAFAELISRLKVEVAAGGLIRDWRGRALLYWRRGAWDMPKGHQEPGESLEECALREVAEETGLTELELGHAICTTYHTYHHKGNFVLKESHWYRMYLADWQPANLQREEDIESVAWCSQWGLKRRLPQAYPSIRDVFAAE